MKQRFDEIKAAEGREIDAIILNSSPFKRCLSTSSMIGRELNISKITVDYDYCEWLSSMLYAENPIPHLALRTTDMAELKRENNWTEFDIIDNDQGFAEANTRYDESKPTGIERLKKNVARQAELTKSPENKGKLIIDINVCHGFFIDETAKVLGHDV